MPVAATDLKWFGCANHAEDDAATQGGAIDLAKKIELTAMAAFDDTLDVLSSSGSDTTQTLTITGRLTSGVIDTEVYNLNGTTPDTGAKTWDYILKAVLSATCVGTVTIRRSGAGATIATLEPGITSVRGLFYNLESNPGSTKTAYEKFFAKNVHGTDSLLGAGVILVTDPTGVSDTLFAVEDAVNDNGTSTNRLSAPSGVSTFRQNGVEEPLPGDTNLDAGEAIGVWLRIDLAAGNSAVISNWTVKITGGTA